MVHLRHQEQHLVHLSAKLVLPLLLQLLWQTATVGSW